MSENPTSTTAVDLSSYQRGDYDPGPLWKRALWYFTSLAFFDTGFPWPSSLKENLLRAFGARLGEGVVLKPRLRIKFPWKLTVGKHTWLGEDVWIDNLAPVKIGDHACLSQGACLMTGNHDRTSPSFDLRLGPIEIGDGAWVGARCVVCPGVKMKTQAVLNAGSIAKGTLKANTIYEGHPAAPCGERIIRKK